MKQQLGVAPLTRLVETRGGRDERVCQDIVARARTFSGQAVIADAVTPLGSVGDRGCGPRGRHPFWGSGWKRRLPPWPNDSQRRADASDATPPCSTSNSDLAQTLATGPAWTHPQRGAGARAGTPVIALGAMRLPSDTNVQWCSSLRTRSPSRGTDTQGVSFAPGVVRLVSGRDLPLVPRVAAAISNCGAAYGHLDSTNRLHSVTGITHVSSDLHRSTLCVSCQ